MGQTVAVVFDIAGLSIINDEYGFLVGDQVIAAAESRLREQTPDDGTVTTIGGGRWLIEISGPDADLRIVPLAGSMRMRPLPCDGPVQHVYFHVRDPFPDERR